MNELKREWASLVAQMVKNLPAVQRPGFDPWVRKIPWRRRWQPTPIFLSGESQRSLTGCSLWVRKESDMTWATNTHTRKREWSGWQKEKPGKISISQSTGRGRSKNSPTHWNGWREVKRYNTSYKINKS